MRYKRVTSGAASAWLVHGDMRQVVPDLVAGALGNFETAAVVTDPPYGETNLEWDRRVPEWPRVVLPMLRGRGHLWFLTSLRNLVATLPSLADYQLAQEIVWEKHNGSSFHCDRFRRVHELAVNFFVGSWSDLYHDAQYTLNATKRTVRHKRRAAHFGNIEEASYESHDGGPKLMRSVIYERSMHRRGIHGTQKPVAVLAPIIRYSAPPASTVLDPFGGSASTACACLLEGRNCVSVEADEQIWTASVERVEKFAGQGGLFA